MHVSELYELIPQILGEDFAQDDYEHLPPGNSPVWRLARAGTVSTVAIFDDSRPHVRIKAGVAFDVPLTSELLMYALRANRTLWSGRLYLTPSNDNRIAVLIMEDIVFAEALDYDFMPGLQDLSTRIGLLTSKAGDLSQEVVGRFGGKPFAARLDWMNLAL